MNNVMLDIEALDSNTTGVLVSIGAVYFDLGIYKLGDEFYTEISLNGMQNQVDKGRTMSLNTLQWWMMQSDEARKVFASNDHKSEIIDALVNFKDFFRGNINIKVWGNGVDYDNVFLRSVFNTYDISCPWQFRNNRCYRTIKGTLGNRAKLVRLGEHHNALDDAKTQAVHLMEMLKKGRS